MDKEIELFAQKAMLLERIKNQRQNLGNLFVPLEKKCNNIDNVADGIIWLRNNKQIVGIATAILVLNFDILNESRNCCCMRCKILCCIES